MKFCMELYHECVSKFCAPQKLIMKWRNYEIIFPASQCVLKEAVEEN
jgi:hypothetical protein